MGRTKKTAKRSRQRRYPRGAIRLPAWWQRLTQRLDWAGRLAERWEPHFQDHWLLLTALLLPLLLVLLAFLFTFLR